MKMGINQRMSLLAAVTLAMVLAAGFAPPAWAEEPVAVVVDPRVEQSGVRGRDEIGRASGRERV